MNLLFTMSCGFNNFDQGFLLVDPRGIFSVALLVIVRIEVQLVCHGLIFGGTLSVTWINSLWSLFLVDSERYYDLPFGGFSTPVCRHNFWLFCVFLYSNSLGLLAVNGFVSGVLCFIMLFIQI